MFSGTTSVQADEINNINYGVQGNHNKIINNHYGSDVNRLDQLAKAACLTASFDAERGGEHPRCHKDTRIAVLNEIRRFFGMDNAASLREGSSGDQGGKRRICWVSGQAGVGKSAIANTIADELKGSERLVGFSFSRSDVNRSHGGTFLLTIAHQLTRLGNYPVLKSRILRALSNDTTLLDPQRSWKDKLEKLICDPLSALGQQPTSHHVVLVIEGLDECRADDAERIISLLAEQLEVGRLRNVSVLVTCRPEYNFKSLSDELCERGLATAIRLDEITGSVDEDIKRYLGSELDGICDKRGPLFRDVPRPWPDELKMKRLVELVNRVFVVAATIIRHVGNRRQDPRKNLAQVLDGFDYHTDIDGIYRHVLSSSSQPTRTSFFLGIITNLAVPLCYNDIEALLGPQSDGFDLMLEACPSILQIPGAQSTEPIHTYHASLRDFLVDRDRSGDYFVPPSSSHDALALCCLTLMLERCKKNMLDLADPFAQHSDSIDFVQKCDALFSGGLDYACRYWSHHVASASYDGTVLSKLYEFATNNLLFWVEAMSLLGSLGDAVLMLREAQINLQATSSEAKELKDIIKLFYDAERFILECMDCIGPSALLIYCNPFLPSGTLLYQTYKHELSQLSEVSVLVRSGLSKDWDSRLRTIQFLSNVVCYALSDDGRLLASCTDAVQLWDVRAGLAITTLTRDGPFTDHDDLQFSQDGWFLAFVNRHTGHIRLWDLKLSKLILDEKMRDIWRFEFSPDGHRCVIAARDTVVVWDLDRLRKSMLPDEDASGARFSLDGRRLLAWSYGGRVVVWDMLNEEWQHTRSIHTLGNDFDQVVWSHDGKRVASLNERSGYTRVVDVSTGDLVSTKQTSFRPDWVHFTNDDRHLLVISWLRSEVDMIAVGAVGEAEKCGRVDWMYAGDRLVGIKVDDHFYQRGGRSRGCDDQGDVGAFGSDKTISLWKVTNRKPDQTLTEFINSTDDSCMTFLTDRGCSERNMKVVVVDALGRELFSTPEFEGHDGVLSLYSAALSPDGSLLACPDKNRVALFNARTGQQKTGVDVGDRVWQLTTSNSHLAIRTSRGVSLYAFAEGTRIHLDESEDLYPGILSFSCDSTLFASKDPKYSHMPVRIWNVRTGFFLHERRGSVITAIQFSPLHPSLLFFIERRSDSSSSATSLYVYDVSSYRAQDLLSDLGDFSDMSISQNGTCIAVSNSYYYRLVELRYSPGPSPIVTATASPALTGIPDIITFSPYRVSPDGWLSYDSMKLCWIPPRYRPRDIMYFRAYAGGICMIPGSGDPVVLQFKDAPWLTLLPTDSDQSPISTAGPTALSRVEDSLNGNAVKAKVQKIARWFTR